MDLVCLIWRERLPQKYGSKLQQTLVLEELQKTTRDIPSYSDLMDYRLGIMAKHNLKLADVMDCSKKIRFTRWRTRFPQRGSKKLPNCYSFRYFS